MAGPRTVPVELGRHYLADGWGSALMPLADFITAHLQPDAADTPTDGRQPSSGAAAVNGASEPRLGYLAQHALFEQIPALAADIRTPHYCDLGEVTAVNAWLGPAGTVTPLHTDPAHNLLAQAVGTKYVRLYPPAAGAAMRPAAGLQGNSSTLELDDPGSAAELAGQPFFEALLTPGLMLYIPPGWWHYVKATSLSFSVSFWWNM